MDSYATLHTHSDYSNIRLKDAICRVPEMIEEAHNLGLKGLVITDHGTIAGHIKAIRYAKDNKDRLGDFKVGLGEEIYLVDKKEMENLKEKNEKISFYHFIITAKNKHGHEFLTKLSTQEWKNGFMYHGMMRVPTYYEWLEDNINQYKGDIIAQSACLGSRLDQLILKYDKTQLKKDYDNIISEINHLVSLFGKEDFYLEVQPGRHEEQLIINKYMPKISKALGIKLVVTTDAHYLSLKQKEVHKIYLQSNGNDNREVDSFYDTTYLMSPEELSSFFEDKNLVSEMFANTLEVMDKIEIYDLKHKAIMPAAHIPDFKEYKVEDYNNSIQWDKYPIIEYFEHSEYIEDRYYLKLILDGMISHNQPFNDTTIDRINTELDVVKAISENFGQRLSNYFLSDREFVNLIWKNSLVGVGRGSAACFYTNYLLDIVQINGLENGFPYWRFANKDRVDNMFDIDLDSQGSKRELVVNSVKERFGKDKVINLGTFNTEGARSSVLSAARGIGLDNNLANSIADLLPNDKGISWDIKDAIYGNSKKDRKPSQEFIEEVDKYPMLKETMLGIQGLISGRSQHASGVSITHDSYDNHFPSMTTTSGLSISQYDAHDCEYIGIVKFDFLSVENLDRIQEAINLLVKDKLIEDTGSIKGNYDKYFHPDKIDVNDPSLYATLYNHDVPKVFQFSSKVAEQGLEKSHPKNFNELSIVNTLIRLTTDGEQLIDKFTRFKNDSSQWQNELDENGLSETEQKTIKRLLGKTMGIADTQEILMTISMDKEISSFSMKEANKLRKSIAKKDAKLQQKQKEIFYDKCYANGTSETMTNYVWDYLIKPMCSYSFSMPHVYSYTMIAIINMYIATKFPSVYWKTASLNVDAGVFGGNFEGTDYASISAAVTNMKSIVELPDINKSGIGFTPHKSNILYALGAISGLNKSDIDAIINNRPYNSLDSFMEALGDSLSQKKIITLIKSGVFHSFDKSTRKIMIEYLSNYTPKKERLTTVQLPKIINNVPKKLNEQKNAYKIKSEIFGRNAIEMNDELEKKFIDNYSKYDIAYGYEKGKLSVDKKSFDKWFNKYIKDLKEWLKTDEAITLFQRYEMSDIWIENCQGNEASWYFETLNYYPVQHQLNYTDIDTLIDIDKFSDFPEQGSKNGKRTSYKKGVIAGTVIDKNRKGIITLITTDDKVIVVRVGKQRFAKYNKKIMKGDKKSRKLVSDSWFNRGETLLIVGYRRGNDFIANNYGTGFKQPLIKISGYKNIKLISEK